MGVGQRGKNFRSDERISKAKDRCDTYKLKWYHK